MANKKNLHSLKSSELELQTLIEVTSNEEHAQCIRMLSMCIAMYKNCFGDIPADIYESFMSSQNLDSDMLSVFENGMNEAISTLGLILKAKEEVIDYKSAGITLN